MMNLFAGSGAMIEQIGQIYALIRQHNGITRQDLASWLDLPATTLNRSLERLLSAGLIRESGLADSSGGRRPSLYQSNSQTGLLLGLDLSGADARLILADLNLNVLDTRQWENWAEINTQDLTGKIHAGCLELAGQDHLTAGMVFGLGLCSPAAAGESLLPDIRAVADRLGLPMPIITPDRASLYAGLWSGLSAAEGERNSAPLLELTVGPSIGLGLGFLTNPALLSAAVANIDQMLVPSPDKLATGGICLGQIATAPAMVSRFQRLKDDPRLEWPDFRQAVQSGKRKAGQILQDAALALAIAVLNTAVGSGCRHLLTGGDAFRDIPEFEAAFRKQLLELAERSSQDIQIHANPYAADLRAVGAAALVLESAINIR